MWVQNYYTFNQFTLAIRQLRAADIYSAFIFCIVQEQYFLDVIFIIKNFFFILTLWNSIVS